MSSLDTPGPPSVLELMVGHRPEAIGEVAMSLWQSLYASLVVIIGIEGFNALYDRCLHQTSLSFAWLNPAESAPSAARLDRFERLRSALESRAAEEATSATVLLLTTFTSVLSSLIGQQLTHTILRTAWGTEFEKATEEISQWPK